MKSSPGNNSASCTRIGDKDYVGFICGFVCDSPVASEIPPNQQFLEIRENGKGTDVKGRDGCEYEMAGIGRKTV